MTTGLGLGFIKTEVSEDEIEVTVEVKASLEASSPSSSGIVGWLKDCFGCFLMITPEGASTMVTSEVKEAIGDVCKALDGNGLTSVVGLDVVCVIFGVVLTINGGLHNGEMDFFPTSAVLG